MIRELREDGEDREVGEGGAPVCSLPDEALRKRAAELRSFLASRGSLVRETDHGLELRFDGSPETLSTLFEVIEFERQCCPFLDFRLHLPSTRGAITVVIGGPEGTLPFLRALV